MRNGIFFPEVKFPQQFGNVQQAIDLATDALVSTLEVTVVQFLGKQLQASVQNVNGIANFVSHRIGQMNDGGQLLLPQNAVEQFVVNHGVGEVNDKPFHPSFGIVQEIGGKMGVAGFLLPRFYPHPVTGYLLAQGKLLVNVGKDFVAIINKIAQQFVGELVGIHAKQICRSAIGIANVKIQVQHQNRLAGGIQQIFVELAIFLDFPEQRLIFGFQVQSAVGLNEIRLQLLVGKGLNQKGIDPLV